jgi:hypothetical protein
VDGLESGLNHSSVSTTGAGAATGLGAGFDAALGADLGAGAGASTLGANKSENLDIFVINF